jgi:hypothetical protein
MRQQTETCICARSHDTAPETSLETLGTIRYECPALYGVFLPDDVWSDFRDWSCRVDNISYHRSVILLALERGQLSKVTSPIHRYLISDGSVRPNVRRQYLNDLQETWMRYGTGIARHRKFRMFLGRLAELQFAEWLEERGWKIVGLEALRTGSDIEAETHDAVRSGFEVKLIGTEDTDFKLILQSLAGKIVADSVSPYAAVNYLLFRVYEAAKQLAGMKNGRRIAVVVVNDLTWWRFKVQLRNAWIDWSKPRFLGDDQAWGKFLEKQQLTYTDLSTDLPQALSRIDGVWIARQQDYKFRLEYETALPRSA